MNFPLNNFQKRIESRHPFSISYSLSVYLSNSIILSFITEAFASHTPAVWFICFPPFFAVSLSHPLQLQLSLNFLHLADTPLPPNPAVCLPSFFPSASRSVLGGNGMLFALINTLHVKGIRMIRWLVTVKVFSHIWWTFVPKTHPQAPKNLHPIRRQWVVAKLWTPDLRLFFLKLQNHWS